MRSRSGRPSSRSRLPARSARSARSQPPPRSRASRASQESQSRGGGPRPRGGDTSRPPRGPGKPGGPKSLQGGEKQVARGAVSSSLPRTDLEEGMPQGPAGSGPRRAIRKAAQPKRLPVPSKGPTSTHRQAAAASQRQSAQQPGTSCNRSQTTGTEAATKAIPIPSRHTWEGLGSLGPRGRHGRTARAGPAPSDRSQVAGHPCDMRGQSVKCVSTSTCQRLSGLLKQGAGTAIRGRGTEQADACSSCFAGASVMPASKAHARSTRQQQQPA